MRLLLSQLPGSTSNHTQWANKSPYCAPWERERLSATSINTPIRDVDTQIPPRCHKQEGEVAQSADGNVQMKRHNDGHPRRRLSEMGWRLNMKRRRRVQCSEIRNVLEPELYDDGSEPICPECGLSYE